MIIKRASIHLMLIAISLFLIIVPAINKTPSRQVAEQSMASAAHFLFLVDTEEYLQSWEASSTVLKNILSSKEWDRQITKLRNFLGPIVSRQHQDSSYTRNASDVPDGEYVILTFLSSFKDRRHATETVTLKLGKDDIWRVAGYYVRYAGAPPPT